MSAINQIDLAHIEHLGEDQLPRLLNVLLDCEANNHDLPFPKISVPRNTKSHDGGCDGKIEWKDGPQRTKYIRNRYSIFQSKASNMSVPQCYNEMLTRNKKQIKPEILKAIEEKGSYTLFVRQAMTDIAISERIKSIREAIKSVGNSSDQDFDVEIYDANKILSWTNLYLPAVVQVQEFNGISRLGFRTWDVLGIDIEAKKTPYQTNDQIANYLQGIRDSMITEKVIRINGHSGLGKTRLVYESFWENKEMHNLLVYYDMEHGSNDSELFNYILTHRHSQSGIMVADNCDSISHQKLANLITEQGNLKIITIGYDESDSNQTAKIKLERNNQKDIVAEIIDQKLLSTHSDSERRYLTMLCEGYPWLAVRFSDAVLRTNLRDLHKYKMNDFVMKLLFQADQHEGNLSARYLEEYNVIACCSVFSAFGFRDDSFMNVINQDYANSLQQQMDFIRTEVYSEALTDSRFREICNKYRQLDIIERRGTYYIVKPTVLAIHMASTWLLKTSPDRIKYIIEKLKNVNLEQKYLERFKDLSELDKAKDIVEALCSQTSFFGTAEALKTSWGSLLFRYFAEVNPKATQRALSRVFEQMPKEDLIKVAESRRNLVWTLEKLCFVNETFEPSAKLLYRFGVAENERWSNNATNQFVHLFQIYLPGTEANFNQRISILQWGLSKNDDDYTRIAIEAMARGLKNGNFTRVGSAEKQGNSPPLQDYSPKNWAEVVDYWENIMTMLIPIATTENSLQDNARKAISQSIRTLIRDGQFKMVDKTARIITRNGDFFWTEAIKELKWILRLERYADEEKENIQNLIDAITPKDILTQLSLKISNPSWDLRDKNYSGRPEDKMADVAMEYAEELYALNVDWNNYFPYLLSGDQRMGFAFGKRLGEIVLDKTGFIYQAINSLSSIVSENQNVALIAGFIEGANNYVLSQAAFDRLLSEPSISRHSFDIIRFIRPIFSDFEKLFRIVDKHHLSVRLFNQLRYGRAIVHLKENEFFQFGDKLQSYGRDGKWAVLSLARMYSYEDKEAEERLLPYLRAMLASENMPLGISGSDHMEVYEWAQIIIKILNTSDDSEFAEVVTRQLIELCADENYFYGMDDELTSIAEILIKEYFQISWPAFGKAIIEYDYIFFMHIKDMIGTKNGYRGREGILFSKPLHFPSLINWCEKHQGSGVNRIAALIPLGIQREGRITWHPFSRDFIDRFGGDKDILRNISANMGTFASVGSRVSYLKSLQELMSELLDHSLELVRQWAQSEFENLDKEIKLESLQDEEDSI